MYDLVSIAQGLLLGRSPTAPPPGYVDVAITHCGICHSDVHQIDDAWKVACFPLVPGHEIVGTIAAVGPDAESQAKFKVGDRAAIGVQRGNCGVCVSCLDKPEFGGRGIRRKGCLRKKEPPIKAPRR